MRGMKEFLRYLAVFVTFIITIGAIAYATDLAIQKATAYLSAPTPPQVILTNSVTNTVVEIKERHWRIIQKRSNGKSQTSDTILWHRTPPKKVLDIFVATK